VYEQFKVTEEQKSELKGLETYIHWLQQLHETGKNIYELTDNEVGYLINYVEANAGRGTVFANNILCELYGICLDAVGGERGAVSDDEAEGRMQKAKNEKSPSNFEGVPEGRGSLYEKITIIPNPTTGILRIEVADQARNDVKIESVEIFDVYGRKNVTSVPCHDCHETILNISHLQSGIYFIKVTTEQGEIVKKVVKQ
jgi:hypothetical protein